jgi:hypothetical protein
VQSAWSDTCSALGPISVSDRVTSDTRAERSTLQQATDMLSKAAHSPAPEAKAVLSELVVKHKVRCCRKKVLLCGMETWN